ncbi:MAG: PDZ domain-containing protein [Planctomycetota bacterium]|nr:PDZ domain-containing protein [Planctomycetota bacterium]
MRLPLPFLLYVTALGLFGWAGWTVYNSLDLFDANTMMEASKGGLKKAQELVKRGKGSGGQASGVNYSVPSWWEQFKGVNLVGKLPPKQPTPEELAQKRREAEKPKVDMTPLEDIFELVSLVYDGKDAGRGGDTHVIIRYKPPTKVQPPAWWLKENQPPGARAGGPRDLSAAPSSAKTRSNRGRGRRPSSKSAKDSASKPAPMPTGMSAQRDGILQKIWVDDGGDQRRSAALWPPYGHISLVRVAGDAQSAFFVRKGPAPSGGEAAPEPKEEELLKTTAEIPQEVLIALRKLQGRAGKRVARSEAPESTQGQWREVEETTRIGDQIHIGRKDEQRFRSSGDFFNEVYVDTYVSKTSSLRGVSVRSVQPKLAQTYGIQTGDVLLEVNSRKITSKAQATNMVKKDYQRGVRTFSTKWLSNGQVVERVYQAPDK